MFTLPELPYSYDALQPHISQQTLEFHHDKHHAGYVTKLNTALENHPDLLAKSIEELLSDISSLPQEIQGAVINNGGQHFNHSLYWQSMSPNPVEPTQKIIDLIKKNFGSMEHFGEQFSAAGANQFGSGWAWLVQDGDKLVIETTLNADSPIMHGKNPLLVMDVWEHAYYLDYQNRRPDYIKEFVGIINWELVESRLVDNN
ncbi:superoxide dismutase [Candidatus Gracilibacteria bacterium]|nr:superoxide dismutase [Thermales bacterium]NJL97176.1 superoxide dismutase [Candidatus Gracilibacteria bacterium]NJS41255.1 superoxide dismutase [Candidatus Gracilibacteria bacterium]